VPGGDWHPSDWIKDYEVLFGETVTDPVILTAKQRYFKAGWLEAWRRIRDISNGMEKHV